MESLTAAAVNLRLHPHWMGTGSRLETESLLEVLAEECDVRWWTCVDRRSWGLDMWGWVHLQLQRFVMKLCDNVKIEDLPEMMDSVKSMGKGQSCMKSRSYTWDGFAAFIQYFTCHIKMDWIVVLNKLTSLVSTPNSIDSLFSWLDPLSSTPSSSILLYIRIFIFPTFLASGRCLSPSVNPATNPDYFRIPQDNSTLIVRTREIRRMALRNLIWRPMCSLNEQYLVRFLPWKWWHLKQFLIQTIWGCEKFKLIHLDGQ